MCDCKIGPGKFEGEGPLTALLYERCMIGGNDYVSYGDGAWASLELGPIDPPDTYENKELREQGYCAGCLAALAADCATIKAASYGQDSRGFAWSQVWDDPKAAQAAYDEDEADMAESEVE